MKPTTRRRKVGHASRGRPHGRFKFDADTVRLIRKRARHERQNALAEEYGVRPETINRLVRRKTYWYVKERG